MTPELINTLESPGEFDALTKLRPGEVYFLLIGRDRLAPPLVDQWADANRRRALADHGHGLIDDAQQETELRKSTQAEAIAEAMREYKRGVEGDAPVVIEAPRPTTYTGHQLPEETARRDEEQRLRTRAVQAIHNAVAEVAALRDFLADDAAMAMLLDNHLYINRALADEITPPRPGIERAQAA